MNDYRFIRKGIWIIGIGLILCLNIVGALPRMYKVHFRPVGSDVAHVRDPQGNPGEILVPVQALGSNRVPFKSDREVEVFVRTSYKDEIITYYPRATLLILVVVGFLHGAVTVCGRWHVTRR